MSWGCSSSFSKGQNGHEGRKTLEGTEGFESKKCKRVVRGLSLGREMIKRWTGPSLGSLEQSMLEGCPHLALVEWTGPGEAAETFLLHHGVVCPPLMAAVLAKATRSVLVTAGSLCQGTSLRAHQGYVGPAAGSAGGWGWLC